MVSIVSLWLPILLSAVGVFIVSSIIHTVLNYHQGDFRKLPKEDELMETFRRLEIPPGDYGMPCAESMKEMNEPAFKEKMQAGPVAFMTVRPGGSFSMGKKLFIWFLYSLLIAVIAAYITGSALRPGAPYLSVFRFAGCVTFTGYSIGLLHDSIWYERSWVTTLKYVFDGLLYGLLTAGVFGWLWPR